MLLWWKYQLEEINSKIMGKNLEVTEKLQKYIDFQCAFKITFINVLVNIVKNTDLIENNEASVQLKKETIKCKDSETYH